MGLFDDISVYILHILQHVLPKNIFQKYSIHVEAHESCKHLEMHFVLQEEKVFALAD